MSVERCGGEVNFPTVDHIDSGLKVGLVLIELGATTALMLGVGEIPPEAVMDRHGVLLTVGVNRRCD